MNNIEHDYLKLLKDILDNGVEKQDRTGTGTRSVFGRQIRHKMSEGFPALTTKKMPFKTIVTELLWFLRGDTNIKYLVDNDCNIWTGDAYKNYFNKTKDLTKDNFEAKGNGVIVIKGFDLKSINQYGNISGTISNSYFIPYTQEEFINKIKTDDEFAKKWGELGPIYGKQWRRWGRKNVVNYDLENVKSSDKVKVMDLIRDGGDYSKYDVKVTYQNNSIDQIQNLISDLKTNPDSRRLMVSAWNVGELNEMVLPPCHYGFQVYTRELSHKERCDLFGHNDSINRDYSYSKWLDDNGFPTRAISLMWNQRSVDTFLGLPFNIASYGLLLEIIAKEVNMIPDELIGNLGDVHLYSNHIEQAKEQMYREPMKLPKLCLDYREGEYNRDLTEFTPEDFVLFDYQSHPAIKAPLSN
jgi:thymidylate synthase